MSLMVGENSCSQKFVKDKLGFFGWNETEFP